MSYVPKEYWLEHGKNYKMNFMYADSFRLQEKILLDYLQGITPFSTVLEVGCGFGRITKLILSNFSENREYIVTDLSADQINEAEKYVSDLRSSRPLRFIVSDIQSLDLKNKYDLVLASEVLMHVLPSDIERTLRDRKRNWKTCGYDLSMSSNPAKYSVKRCSGAEYWIL